MSGVRLLVIDDDEMVRESLALVLRDRGFDVMTVSEFDRPTVERAAAEHRPQVVLLDYHLDDDTSEELIAPLSSTGVPVLMLTGSTDPEILGACLDLGAVGILKKRQPIDELVRAVDLAVDGLAPQRPQERDELLAVSRESRARRAEALAPFDALSARERSVLEGLLDGLSAEEIAARDYVSLATVRTQIRAVLTKLDVTSQLAAVARARRAGWTPSA